MELLQSINCMAIVKTNEYVIQKCFQLGELPTYLNIYLFIYLLITLHTYIHNWTLQPFTQDYGLVSHTAHVVQVNFIREWRNLTFKA